jgi:primosomal protein N' (replication factor Y) (superfamily II helicase)
MLVSVALPLPLFKPLTYEVPEEFATRVAPGSRVIVPVRGRRVMGFVVGPAEAKEGVKPKPIHAAPDAIPPLDAPMLELCRWVAHYYFAPLGLVIRAALPAALTGPESSDPHQKTRKVASIAKALPTLMERAELFKRAKRQREAYEMLESVGGTAPVELLVEQHRFTQAVIKSLADRGLISITEEVVARDPFAHLEPTFDTKHAATRAQIAAIDALHAGKPGEVFLLHGVTGSGKTLVYLHLLRKVMKQGKGAIVLVPEIALTPQTVSRFRAIFGNLVAVLHSGLSDGERYDAWLALRTGKKKIAVGARSAVFAPIQELGAIVIDEEHETTYKQGEAPRYHARETAIIRARIQGSIVVLGSATPSLETWANTRTGKYHMLSMPDRVGGASLPFVHVVDQRAPKTDGAVVTKPATPEELVRRVISEPLEDALRERVAREEQSILLLNRRGYSAFVQCAECGDVDACPNCSISFTYHRAPERLMCHYCQHSETPRDTCRRCGGAVLRQRGLGTQQVERILAERIPTLRIARMDVDTTSRKWSHAEILDRVGRGEVDVLLGTQMIAKGLDYPNVTLVGVVDADVGINLPDFRASERCFQLLSQVAGRAGRGTKGGDVYIQTRVPRHHAVRCAVEHDYVQFVRLEMEGRREPLYPPSVRLINVVCSGPRESEVMKLAESAAEALRGKLAERGDNTVTIVGPAKCPIERIKNRWRWHFMLKSSALASLQRAGRFLARMPVPAKGQMRVVVDRDPVSLL